MKNTSYRILAEGALMNNDTWTTGVNNNDLIIGPSGSGKTRSYVIPNILLGNESMVIADTKGSLIGLLRPSLRKMGFRVVSVDFTDTASSYGYNPLDFIRYDAKRGRYCEQDIATLCAALIPLETPKDPFWEQSARILLAALVGYVLECLPPEEHTLAYVVKLFGSMSETPPEEGKANNGASLFERLFRELGQQNPDSFAYRQFLFYSNLTAAQKTDACVRSFLAEKLGPMSYDGPTHMFSSKKRLDFRSLGRRKTAAFLTVSDTDRSMDRLVNVFYTQALHTLCRSADRDYPDHRLRVPVRFILDDFATNTQIPDFDNIISVIRSREIYVSVILQSISQLSAIYGRERSMTIINNCDNCLYLGGQDVETARYIAVKANKTADTILNMPLGQAYLFTRGAKPKPVRKYTMDTCPIEDAAPDAEIRPAQREAG